MKHTTTLNRIKSFNPCVTGWKAILQATSKTEADDEIIDFAFIAVHCTAQDTIWGLRATIEDNKFTCVYLATEFALSVIHLTKSNQAREDITKALKWLEDNTAAYGAVYEVKYLAVPNDAADAAACARQAQTEILKAWFTAN